MEESNWRIGITGAIIGAVIIYFILGGSGKYEGQTAEQWYSQYDASQSQVTDLQSALQEANDNIDQANNNIEDAKRAAWESYDDMGNTLDSLETVDNVNQP
jgi:peptidoglycan hydrolase CwlO-like protein